MVKINKVEEILTLARVIKGFVEMMDPELREKYGKKMMDSLSDYPLYASTSNITYDEALAIGAIMVAFEENEGLNERV